MNFHRANHLSAAFIAILLAIFSLYILQKEINAEWSLTNSPPLTLFSDHNPTNPVAFSNRSDHNLLLLCLAKMSSSKGRLLPLQPRMLLLNNCAELSSSITQTSPNNGFAWFVLAFASHKQADFETYSNALTNSYKTAPNALWLAEIRTIFAEHNFDHLSPNFRIYHENDLALLLHANSGLTQLSQWYIHNTGFRDRFSSILARQPPRLADRFIADLKGKISDLPYE